MEERKFSELERGARPRRPPAALYVCADGLGVSVPRVRSPSASNDPDVESQKCSSAWLLDTRARVSACLEVQGYFRGCTATNCVTLAGPDCENEEYAVVVSGAVLSRTACALVRVWDETKEFTFPNTVRWAKRVVLAGARGLRAVHFNKGLEMLGNEYPDAGTEDTAFEGSRLRELWFSSLPLRAEPGLLQCCEALRCVHLPDGLETVQEDWFQESGIVRIDISRSVREIQPHAFYGCTQLHEITLTSDSALELIDVGAFRGTALETFVAPPALRVVAQEAFRECKMLCSVALNEGLEQLGTDDLDEVGDPYRGPFYDSGLEAVLLPTTVH